MRIFQRQMAITSPELASDPASRSGHSGPWFHVTQSSDQERPVAVVTERGMGRSLVARNSSSCASLLVLNHESHAPDHQSHPTLGHQPTLKRQSLCLHPLTSPLTRSCTCLPLFSPVNASTGRKVKLLTEMVGKSWSQFFDRTEERTTTSRKSGHCDNMRLKKEGEDWQSMCRSDD